MDEKNRNHSDIVYGRTEGMREPSDRAAQLQENPGIVYGTTADVNHIDEVVPVSESSTKRETPSRKKKSPVYVSLIRYLGQAAAVICLLILCYRTYQDYREQYPNTASVTEEQEAGDAVKEVSGTWCTLKSNSLDGVPVFSEAGSTEQIGFFPEGKCCQIEKTQVYEGKEWAQVSYCGLTGWMKKSNLHFISDGAEYIKIGDTAYMNALTDKGINGYASPSTSADVVKSGITYGTEYEILEFSNGWGRVEENGTSYWINMYHMGSYPDSAWKVETLSRAAKIHLREKPEENQSILTDIPEHQELTMTAYENGWGQVTYDGKTGWVMLHYLTPYEK